MSLQKNRFGSLETLEQRQLMAADAFAPLEPAVEPMPIEPVPSVVVSELASAAEPNSNDWFVADSFSFGVEREMKESSEHPTTPLESDAYALDAAMEQQPICYLKYKLERCFVKSWSISGDADDRPTEDAAYYNKIAFSYAQTVDGKEF